MIPEHTTRHHARGALVRRALPPVGGFKRRPSSKSEPPFAPLQPSEILLVEPRRADVAHQLDRPARLAATGLAYLALEIPAQVVAHDRRHREVGIGAQRQGKLVAADMLVASELAREMLKSAGIELGIDVPHAVRHGHLSMVHVADRRQLRPPLGEMSRAAGCLRAAQHGRV